LLSQKTQIQTTPDEREQKLIIRPAAPSNSLQTTNEVKKLRAEVVKLLRLPE
jgi:hypothetical protein